ncbi:glycoside hydrolase family 26 protein [Streptomyces beihaiensis]|uniref:Glycosyl hydrolase n=1 Tax=Streptomyces beihaiensis TaxID=2984495 RepID=A0ABT3U084_9ACTN|nr:glycosyl hydrolase [Streptomyces beihaiensis]MCX3062709.1 glycosyl hydrolase [Streptomyces beihaiensis]
MVRRRRRAKRSRLPLITSGALVSLVVASGSVSVVPADASPRGGPSPVPPAPAAPALPSPTWSSGAVQPGAVQPDSSAAPSAAPSGTASPGASPGGSPSGGPSGDASPGSVPGSSPGSSPGPGASRGTDMFPAFGAFLDSGKTGVARIPQLSQWLGGADLRVGHTYLPGERWTDIEGTAPFLSAWAAWRRQRDDRMFVLNVPMQARNEAGVSDWQVRHLIRRGAAGDFDVHFKALAQRLVDLKIPDTVIVLGWEMNGTTYTHRCGPDPELWKKYWQRIVKVMRSVPGQKFTFDFAPSRGRDAVPWTKCYPGDDVVDIIGMDSYDQPSGISFDQQVTEPYGLQKQVDFAAEHGKPISYPEWGLFRNGDDAEYMRRMLAWMDEHNPLYNTLTDYCPHGVWECDENPKAAKVYRAALSGRDKPVAPTQPTTPTTPTTPPNCTPLDLGDWVEHWLGGKLCLRFDWFSRDR